MGLGSFAAKIGMDLIVGGGILLSPFLVKSTA
jgi:hypothetical protein